MASATIPDAYGRVRRAILSGELAPGEPLSQARLAEQLAVGLTPLREALRILQGEGLVTGEPNRRVKVAAMTAADLEELCVMRMTLEVAAQRLSVEPLPPEVVGRLEGHLAAMDYLEERDEWAGWARAHRAFHRELTGLAGPRLKALLENLADHCERYCRAYGPDWRDRDSSTEHREIADAAKAGDRRLSAALLAGHLARPVLTIMPLLDPRHQPRRLETAMRNAGCRPGSAAATPARATAGTVARRRSASPSERTLRGRSAA